jgi:hypothetical protein
MVLFMIIARFGVLPGVMAAALYSTPPTSAKNFHSSSNNDKCSKISEISDP